jgi:predicted PurR-regulated permease PerM
VVERRPEYRPVFAGIAFAFVLLLLALLLWHLGRVLLLVFFSLVMGVLLSRVVSAVARLTRLPRVAALAAVLTAALAAGMGLAALALPPFLAQLRDLTQNFPVYAATAEERLQRLGERIFGHSFNVEALTDSLGSYIGGALSQGLAWLGTTGAILATAAGVFIFAIFLSLAPEQYRRGLLRLFPVGLRPKSAKVIDRLADAMAGWGFAKAISMAVIGLLSTIGFWLVGVPSFLVFGILAGLLSFVPYIGTALGLLLPAIAVAASNPSHLLWITVVWAVVQFIEGNLIMPLALKRGANVPEALEILGFLVLGELAGFIGILTADPLLAVLVALVDAIYIGNVVPEAVRDDI